MLDIKIEKTTCPKEKPAASTLGFGKKFSDHMFVMEYKEGEGWKNPRIIPFGNISLSPASTVFHYGAEIFEGMKAYRTPDGKIQMVKIDADWVPHEPETSLYLRPFTIANDPFLGVHPATEAIFMIIASPVGSYYAEGLNPVSIMIETEDVRAVRGGTGYAKCGGNYGASLRAGKKAEEKGYSQVLWLDGVERKYIEEVGAMNVMFMVGDEIITPALTGSILPGITRKSCIELLRSRGYKVTERQFSLEELKVACENGTLKEAWGCGTAAVVSPIGKLVIGDESYIINNNEIGAVTQELYDTLTGIQWGKIEDTFGWVYPVV